MTPDAWEQECLAEVRQALSTVEAVGAQHEVHDVRLEGSDPDTKLIVDLAVWGEERTLTFDLWGPDFEAFPGQREGPNRVGTLISVWVIEQTKSRRRGTEA